MPKPQTITVSPRDWGIWGDSILQEQKKNDEKQREKMENHVESLKKKGFTVIVK